MNRTEAERILELVPGEAVSVRSVRAAFARQIKAIHPDTVDGYDNGRIVMTVDQVKAARDLLLEGLAEQKRTCVLCHGTGSVRGRMGQKTCAACNGTGDKFR